MKLFYILFLVTGCTQLKLNSCSELNKFDCNPQSSIKIDKNPSLDKEILQHQPVPDPFSY